MSKRSVYVTIAILFLATLTPVFSALVAGRAQDQLLDQPVDQAAVASLPTHFDTTDKPLREMFPTRSARVRIPRNGRDFEPGRPLPVGNANPTGTDLLAALSQGSPAGFISPKASTTGTPRRSPGCGRARSPR